MTNVNDDDGNSRPRRPISGRGTTTTKFTQLPQWIQRAVDPGAAAMWCYLLDLLWINQTPDGDPVEATLQDLADAAKLKQSRTASRFINQLITVGAIEQVDLGGPGRHYGYIIHTDPPGDYDGPMTTEEWIRDRNGSKTAGQAKSAFGAGSKNRRDGSKPAGSKAVENSRQEKPQVKPKVRLAQVQHAFDAGSTSSIETSTHTHIGPDSEEAKAATSAEAETGVCVSETETDKPDPRGVAVIAAVVPEAARSHYQENDLATDTTRVAALLGAGWTTRTLAEAITANLERPINDATTYPAKWVRGALDIVEVRPSPAQAEVERRAQAATRQAEVERRAQQRASAETARAAMAAARADVASRPRVDGRRVPIRRHDAPEPAPVDEAATRATAAEQQAALAAALVDMEHAVSMSDAV